MDKNLGDVIVALIDERMSQFRTRLESVEKLLQLLVAHEVRNDGVHPIPGEFMLGAVTKTVTKTLIDKKVVSRDGLDLSMARLKGDIQRDWLNQFKTWSNNAQADIEGFKGHLLNRAGQLTIEHVDMKFQHQIEGRLENLVEAAVDNCLDNKSVTLKVY